MNRPSGKAKRSSRALFGNSRDAIFITDSKGRLTDVNPSFVNLLGYSEEEAKELRAVDTYANREDHKIFLKAFDELGSVKDFEVKLKRKDGAVMSCLLTGTAQRGHDGTVHSYQGIVVLPA